jgi:hypothetical protein
VPTRVLGTTDVVFCSAASKATEKQRYNYLGIKFKTIIDMVRNALLLYSILGIRHKES